jgi:hypothetical protein
MQKITLEGLMMHSYMLSLTSLQVMWVSNCPERPWDLLNLGVISLSNIPSALTLDFLGLRTILSNFPSIAVTGGS